MRAERFLRSRPETKRGIGGAPSICACQKAVARARLSPVSAAMTEWKGLRTGTGAPASASSMSRRMYSRDMPSLIRWCMDRTRRPAPDGLVSNRIRKGRSPSRSKVRSPKTVDRRSNSASSAAISSKSSGPKPSGTMACSSVSPSRRKRRWKQSLSSIRRSRTRFSRSASPARNGICRVMLIAAPKISLQKMSKIVCCRLVSGR